MNPSFFPLPDGQRIAYHRFVPDTMGSSSGTAPPGIIFLGGFKSDMQGTKALFLDELCRARGIPFLRFDYLGHGESSGAFEDGTIGLWKRNALAALDRLTEGPQILVGSSMGGWIMLLTAIARPERIAALIGIAAAPDFTEDRIWDALDERGRRALLTKGVHHMPQDACNDPAATPEPYPITRQLIEEARTHLLLRHTGALPIRCPVRLIHGMADADVPWQTSLRLVNKLESADATLHLSKSGAHRMSEPADLALIGQVVHAATGAGQ